VKLLKVKYYNHVAFAVGRPRRSPDSSTTSSWTSVAVCNISMIAAAMDHLINEGISSKVGLVMSVSKHVVEAGGKRMRLKQQAQECLA
jgi:hypothetical protein